MGLLYTGSSCLLVLRVNGCRRVPEPPADERSEDELADFRVYRPQPKARGWRLLRTEDGFRVLGTPPTEEERRILFGQPAAVVK